MGKIINGLHAGDRVRVLRQRRLPYAVGYEETVKMVGNEYTLKEVHRSIAIVYDEWKISWFIFNIKDVKLIRKSRSKYRGVVAKA